MKPFLSLRRIACEGPGFLAQVLDRREIPYQIIRIERGEAIPVSPARASAPVFMEGFVRDRLLTLQCHVERTADWVREWAARYRDELEPTAPRVQSAEAMQADLDVRVNRLQRIAGTLYARWLRGLALGTR